MGFKSPHQKMTALIEKLQKGMSQNGISEAIQEEVVENIQSFAHYGFPESHSASFALIAYASAYLKAHHPAAFLCALLNSQPMANMSSPLVGNGLMGNGQERSGTPKWVSSSIALLHLLGLFCHMKATGPRPTTT